MPTPLVPWQRMWPLPEYHGAGAWSTECIIKIVTFIVTNIIQGPRITAQTSNTCLSEVFGHPKAVATLHKIFNDPTKLLRLLGPPLHLNESQLQRSQLVRICCHRGYHRTCAIVAIVTILFKVAGSMFGRSSHSSQSVYFCSAGFHGLLNDRLN